MRTAQRAIRTRMRSGELIQLEDRVLSLLTEGETAAWREVLLAVTDEHIIWVDLKRAHPEAMSLRYDDVVRASFDGETLRLSRRDPSTPQAETDVWFSFPYEDRGASVRKALEAKLGEFGSPESQT